MLPRAWAGLRQVERWGARHLETALGGGERTRVIILLACVLGLASADAATVGAAATPLINGLHITNTDIGLLVTASSLVAAAASLPFGVVADRGRRVRVLSISVFAWGVVMVWSATVSTFGGLLLVRVVLGLVTAGAGPLVASLVGDWFPSAERGRIYGYVLTGELLGAGLGFEVSGDVAAISWRAAFLILAVPAFVLARLLFRLPEPARGGRGALYPVGHHDGVASSDGSGAAGGAAGTAAAARDLTLGVAPARTGNGAVASLPPGAGGIGGAGVGGGGGGGGADPSRPSAETDVQRLARERNIEPDPDLVLTSDPRRMGILTATRYVLRIRTNVVLIVAGACGYYFLAGVQTFGMEFVTKQYHLSQFLAGSLMIFVGAGAVAGVLVAGRLSDRLLQRGVISARILVSAVAAAVTTVAFIPALVTRSPLASLPYLVVAAFALGAQNPPIDAARLDIVPPLLWGRAEGVRSTLRTAAQSVAPTLFGAVSEYVFGGGARPTAHSLQWTFFVMLLPLAANSVILFRAVRTYPRDAATAAANAERERSAMAVAQQAAPAVGRIG